MEQTVAALKISDLDQRIKAKLIDMLINLPFLGLGYLIYKSPIIYVYLAGPLFIFAIWYNVLLVSKNGGTPGKRIMNIRIVKIDGSPIDLRSAILRYLVDAVFMIISTVGIALATLGTITDPSSFDVASTVDRIWLIIDVLAVLLNHDRQALHDYIANTLVVKDPEPSIADYPVA